MNWPVGLRLSSCILSNTVYDRNNKPKQIIPIIINDIGTHFSLQAYFNFGHLHVGSRFAMFRSKSMCDDLVRPNRKRPIGNRVIWYSLTEKALSLIGEALR